MHPILRDDKWVAPFRWLWRSCDGVSRFRRKPNEVKGELEGLLSRLHVLVVGPGLGREPYMQSYAKMALEIAKDKVRSRHSQTLVSSH